MFNQAIKFMTKVCMYVCRLRYLSSSGVKAPLEQSWNTEEKVSKINKALLREQFDVLSALKRHRDGFPKRHTHIYLKVLFQREASVIIRRIRSDNKGNVGAHSSFLRATGKTPAERGRKSSGKARAFLLTINRPSNAAAGLNFYRARLRAKRFFTIAIFSEV